MNRHGTPDPETQKRTNIISPTAAGGNPQAQRILELEAALRKANKTISEMATSSVKLKEVLFLVVLTNSDVLVILFVRYYRYILCHHIRHKTSLRRRKQGFEN